MDTRKLLKKTEEYAIIKEIEERENINISNLLSVTITGTYLFGEERIVGGTTVSKPQPRSTYEIRIQQNNTLPPHLFAELCQRLMPFGNLVVSPS